MSFRPDTYSRPRVPSPQPTFTRMTSAVSIPSSRGSPALMPAYRNGSLQSTPEGIVPMSSSLPNIPQIPPYTLPESLLPTQLVSSPTSTPSAMAEALGKGPGLIRRVSRGAQGIPSRLRRGNSSTNRDRSSGPVIMRRRSDSRTAADGDTGLSDFDGFEEEDAVEDAFREPINALGISSNRPGDISIPDLEVIAPIRNSRLEQGTVLKKITKKDSKDINLRLDLESAKVFWDPSRPSKCFYIDDVKEIRCGEEAQHYREECMHSENWAPYWFTIVYTDTTRSRGRTKTMNLIAPDVGVYTMWTETLDSVSRNRIDMMAGLMGFADKSARLVWQCETAKRPNGAEGEITLDFPSIVQLCRSLHINCTEATLRTYFQKADTQGTGQLNQSQFLFFVRRLKERKDIKQIFKSFTGGSKEMDKVTFFSFLQREQGIDVNSHLDHWTVAFVKIARATRPKATPVDGGEIPLPPTMNFPAFQTFLTSAANSILKPVSPEVQLNRPLNEYYISSSHNTYLLGGQVRGESSTEAYITVLQKGCRCVEIDCWDGSDGKPVVTHGRTLTSSILFHDTIKVINKYAFTESAYPLILSLEVHCTDNQQAQMVSIMIAELGDKLVLEPLDLESQTLPSPEDLKHKILIKVKAATEDLDARALTNELANRKREREHSFSSPWNRPILLNDHAVPSLALLSSPPSMSPPERATTFWTSPRTSTTSTNNTVPTSAIVSSAEESDSPQATVVGDSKKSKKKQTSKVINLLGDLGVYTRGVKFNDFNGYNARTFNHVFSINERAFEKLTRPGAREKHMLEEHNVRCLMRVYPHAFRINSSNFDPLKFWRRGVQMAALNCQTYDLGQQLNEAMFAGGDDRTGYVLKPAALRPEGQSPTGTHKKAPKKEVKFTVQIISAQQLPRPSRLGPEANINPYVEFEMYCAEDMGANATGVGGQDASARNGHSGIGNPLRKRTRIVEGNGYNPEFGNEIEMKVTTRYPSLVFVRWTVWNSVDARTTNHAPLATFTAKLNSIQQGYRHLPLFDSNGEQYLFSTLFCKIKKQDIVDAPEPIVQRTGSRRSSIDRPSASPLQEPANPKSRNFVRRLLSRAPSERRRRKEERVGGDSRESEFDSPIRPNTLDR